MRCRSLFCLLPFTTSLLVTHPKRIIFFKNIVLFLNKRCEFSFLRQFNCCSYFLLSLLFYVFELFSVTLYILYHKMYKGINFHPYFKTFEENSDKFNYSTRHSLLGTISIHLIKFITMLICKYMHHAYV